MAIEIGSCVSPELNEFILTFTNAKEREEIRESLGIGQVNGSVALNGRALTDSTLPYILALREAAIKNRPKKLSTLNKVYKEIKDIA